MVHPGPIVPVALLAASLGIAACTQNVGVASTTEKTATGTRIASAFTRFPDMPLPKDAEIDLEHTLIFGADEAWFGRLVLSAAYSANDVFGFYKRELPRFGWEEITTTRSKVSTLTYNRQDRVATILIEAGTIRGSEFLITVSPRGAPAMAPQPPEKPAQ